MGVARKRRPLFISAAVLHNTLTTPCTMTRPPILRALLVCSGIALLLAASPAGPAAAEGAPAVIRLDPASLTLEPEQTGHVTVTLQGARDLYGIDVGLVFDPAVVEVVDADPATDGVQIAAGQIPAPDFIASDAADNTLGRMRYTVTQVNPTPPAAGDGVVFSFDVRAKAAGTSLLEVRFAEAADRDGMALPLRTENGAVVVDGGPPPTAAPTGIPLSQPSEEPPASAPAPGTATAAAPAVSATAPAETAAATSPSATAPTQAATGITAPATLPPAPETGQEPVPASPGPATAATALLLATSQAAPVAQGLTPASPSAAASTTARPAGIPATAPAAALAQVGASAPVETGPSDDTTPARERPVWLLPALAVLAIVAAAAYTLARSRHA